MTVSHWAFSKKRLVGPVKISNKLVVQISCYLKYEIRTINLFAFGQTD